MDRALRDRIVQFVRQPPRTIAIKLGRAAARQARRRWDRWRDSRCTTYSDGDVAGRVIARLRVPPPTELLGKHAEWLRAVTPGYLAQRFDLLGSGWVSVGYEAEAAGIDGIRFDSRVAVAPDADGVWLESRINGPNLPRARELWRLIRQPYTPVDWQRDPKSGYRWSEACWAEDIVYGGVRGADVKLAWDLSRAQHLPQLALAWCLAAKGRAGFELPERYANAFRNWVLDFAANNPPRYGVNWSCAMDVGIRVANWLLAYDLFRAGGACFDEPFECAFARSVREHGEHLIAHLEWFPWLRSNHYLANVAGLLFVATHLPRDSQTDAWRAFAVQELVEEGDRQFHADGSNFEASTSYHRLSAEMLVYCTALVAGFGEEGLRAMTEYDHRRHRVTPPLRPAPLPLHPYDEGLMSPIPPATFAKLARMARFTMDITRPDGRIVQIGDNDSGRFFKLEPRYCDARWHEDILDHRHLADAIGALCGTGVETGSLDAWLVSSLARGRRVAAAARVGSIEGPEGCCAPYRDFGLYIYRGGPFWLAVRAGPVGQRGIGGHAHNDQLSVELCVAGVPLIVDPGTYVYTALPEERNRLRATSSHNTLVVEGLEQNPWAQGRAGLFRLMEDRTHARALTVEARRFVGEHAGYGAPHRRSIEFRESRVVGRDEYTGAGDADLRFHLAPGVSANVEGASVTLRARDLRLRLVASVGRWSKGKGWYCRGYGWREPIEVLKLSGFGTAVEWEVDVSR